ncbi:MAG: TIGR02221 family CRISPR-associated protein [Thermodesulfobacteriota bacterium]|nr:TIGR02221 family CRISPR-associated protein [Thermodesulfobacteriota bacterium]
MRKVYLSFLGIGSKKANGIFEYDKAVYVLNGKKSKETEFVQVAEIQILGPSNFDMILIVATQKSYDTHFKDNLKTQLLKAGANEVSYIIISEDMTPEGQWEWFERILNHIEYGDELTIDLTHGYRSIPIVFSTAINFLQKSRRIILNAVYYGAYDKNRKLAPIINMKDFYTINEWADAVSRLVEDADARKMAEVAERTSEFQVAELNDPEVISTFEDLTNTIRNVDINNVSKKANAAIELIKAKERMASVTGKVLLKLVIDKFVSITTKEPVSGKYDKAYFNVQIEIIKLLLEHKLFMQAYTVMREFIGSIGLIKIEKARINTKKGRNKRYRFADTFINMLQYEESQWKFKESENVVTILKPFYTRLKNIGVESTLRDFTKELTDYRNGFDHAWTSKKEACSDIEEKGYQFFHKLKEVVLILEENSIF